MRPALRERPLVPRISRVSPIPRVTPLPRAVPPHSGEPALTDHLLQLVIVPVDGPGQGARVLGHDGSSAPGPPSNSLTSLLSSPRLSPPPTAAAATPPISSRTTRSGGRLGAGSPRGGAAERRRLEAPEDLASCSWASGAPRPGPSPVLGLRGCSDWSFAWARPLRPALHPGPTHGPNFPFTCRHAAR